MVEEASVVIRRGRLDEGARLKEIAIAAKSFWGYEREKVLAWAGQGDFSPRRLAELVIFVADAGGRSIAWSALTPRGEVGWLEDLWVEPDWIGKGVGTALFRRTAAEARALGATWLEWEAEPNAIGFYEKMGARYIRNSTSEWDRTLSMMGVDLDRYSSPPDALQSSG